MGAPFPTPKRGSKPQNFGPPILLSLKSLGLRVLPFSTPSSRIEFVPFSPFHGLCYILNWIELTMVFHHINYLLLLHKRSIALKFHWATISFNFLTILTQFSHNCHFGNQIDWTFYLIFPFRLWGSCWFSICVCKKNRKKFALEHKPRHARPWPTTTRIIASQWFGGASLESVRKQVWHNNDLWAKRLILDIPSVGASQYSIHEEKRQPATCFITTNLTTGFW
jgi:hypothetical protein